MRVLIVTNMFPTAAEPWFGSFVRDQVHDLRALGIDVDVFAFDGRTRTFEYAIAAAKVRRRVREGRYDLVHAHYGLTGAVALAQHSVPIITTFHGTDVGYVAWKRYVSWVVSRVVEPIFVNRAMARNVGLADARVIPPGVDTELFRPGSRLRAREALGWARERRYVLLPGARNLAVKNAPLFDATTELLRSVLRGVVPVSLEGFTRKDAALVLRACDVLLMTSLSEGSPLTVKEALASGTPVVSVDVGDVSEVIESLPGCSIRRREPRDLAEGVREALRSMSPVRTARLRARAEEFARPTVAARVASVYEEVRAH